jgi:hypothetical protein
MTKHESRVRLRQWQIITTDLPPLIAILEKIVPPEE